MAWHKYEGQCQLIPNTFVPIDPEQWRAIIPLNPIRQEVVP